MKLIVGLGNPGEEYQKTRHNVGWMLLDTINEESEWQKSKRAQAYYAKKTMEGQEVEFIKPTAFMNNSGASVVYAKRKHPKLQSKDIIVVHDDLDLPLGKIRISFGASSAGHKGVQSIIDALKTKNFWRLRIGIAPSPSPLPSGERIKVRGKTEKFVLRPFKKDEQKLLKETLDKAVEALLLALKEPERAMSLYN